jgi:hypothetical protein
MTPTSAPAPLPRSPADVPAGNLPKYLDIMSAVLGGYLLKLQRTILLDGFDTTNLKAN